MCVINALEAEDMQRHVAVWAFAVYIVLKLNMMLGRHG